jgi:MFS transporter, AAHS family, benzoate transport protein
VVTPTASALILEYAPPGRKNFVYALMFSGIGIGGLLSALLSLALVPAFGWRVMFLIGAAPLVVVLPLAYRFLPESIAFLHARGRRHEAAELARRHQLPLDELVAAESTTARRRLQSMATPFSREHIAATVLFWLATAVALLLIFALNTWLPQLMRKAGFDLGSAVRFLLVLNLGAVLGTIGAARVVDRVGSKPVVTIAFLGRRGRDRAAQREARHAPDIPAGRGRGRGQYRHADPHQRLRRLALPGAQPRRHARLEPGRRPRGRDRRTNAGRRAAQLR